MQPLVIKFEHGYRLCRKHKVIELWKDDRKLAEFPQWADALHYLDNIDPDNKEDFAQAKIN